MSEPPKPPAPKPKTLAQLTPAERQEVYSNAMPQVWTAAGVFAGAPLEELRRMAQDTLASPLAYKQLTPSATMRLRQDIAMLSAAISVQKKIQAVTNVRPSNPKALPAMGVPKPPAEETKH